MSATTRFSPRHARPVAIVALAAVLALALAGVANAQELAWRNKTTGRHETCCPPVTFNGGLHGVCCSPVLSTDNTMLYVGSDDAHVYAINAADGATVWKFKLKYSARSSPVLSTDNTMLYTAGQDDHLFAINAADGAMVWQYPSHSMYHSLPGYHSPVLNTDNTILYAAGIGGCLSAINAVDGTMVWQSSERLYSPPVVSADNTMLYGQVYGENHQGVFAISAVDGAVVWWYDPDIGGYAFKSSPVLSTDSTMLYVGSSDGILAINAVDGEMVWNYSAYDGSPNPTGHTLQGRIETSPVLSSDNTRLYFATGNTYRSVYAINAVSGTLVWSFTAPPSEVWIARKQSHFHAEKVFSSPIVSMDGSILYFTSDDGMTRRATGHIYAVNTADGAMVWRYETGNAMRSTPVLSTDNRMLYVGSDDDRIGQKYVNYNYIYAIDKSRFELCHNAGAWTGVNGTCDCDRIAPNDQFDPTCEFSTVDALAKQEGTDYTPFYIASAILVVFIELGAILYLVLRARGGKTNGWKQYWLASEFGIRSFDMMSDWAFLSISLRKGGLFYQKYASDTGNDPEAVRIASIVFCITGLILWIPDLYAFYLRTERFDTDDAYDVKHHKRFTSRVTLSVLLFEDIPQLALSSTFLYVVGFNQDKIAATSFAFSLLSLGLSSKRFCSESGYLETWIHICCPECDSTSDDSRTQ